MVGTKSLQFLYIKIFLIYHIKTRNFTFGVILSTKKKQTTFQDKKISAKMHFRIYNNCFTRKLANINQYCAPSICMHRVHLLILDILLPPVITRSNSLHFEVKKVQ